MRRRRLCRQYFEISFVALCSQSLSAAKRIISTAANHFGALPQNIRRDRTAPPLHSAQGAAPFRQPSHVKDCVSRGKFRHSAELNGATKAALNSPLNDLRTQRRSRRKTVGAPLTYLLTQ
jgi:hypothetical protein